MNGLIPLDNLSIAPVTDEILALNQVSAEYGLLLTEDEARELSETRSKALKENDRIEFGSETVKKIIGKFCSSRYLDVTNYADVLNEITYYFYYIKTETGDKISDDDLIEEMFTRFELFSRGDIDRFEAKEIERIIRKIVSGEHYQAWYGDDDRFDPFSFGRETPENLLDDTVTETPAEDEEGAGQEVEAIADEDDVDLDLFDDFSSENEEDFDYVDAGSGWANEDDESLYDEVGTDALEEDDPDHPFAGIGKKAGQTDRYFAPGSLRRMAGIPPKQTEPDEEEEEEDGEISGFDLPGGATLTVGSSWEDVGLDSAEDLDDLDSLLDRIAKLGRDGKENGDE